MTETFQKRYLIFLRLPQDLQKALFDMKTINVIETVSQENNLSNDQRHWASHTVGVILLGEVNIVGFVKTLQEKCQLDETLARQLARDINQTIFLSVKESLKKIHQVSEWPREDEPKRPTVPEPAIPTIPKPNEPRIEGNIVDLKQE